MTTKSKTTKATGKSNKDAAARRAAQTNNALRMSCNNRYEQHYVLVDGIHVHSVTWPVSLRSGGQIFKAADVFLFCSAVISREVMEADPMNIVHCPYNVFVAETGDGVMIGRRNYPDGPMDRVEAFIDGIIAEAVGN